LIKATGFHRVDQVNKNGIEGVEGRIHSGVVAPEFHASIVFEEVFDNKQFC
jgi:hypothetical protein